MVLQKLNGAQDSYHDGRIKDGVAEGKSIPIMMEEKKQRGELRCRSKGNNCPNFHKIFVPECT